jgi:hypothetical protein
MENTKAQLRQLQSTKASKAFHMNAKRRLLQKITVQNNEYWLLRLLNNIFKPKVLNNFRHLAKVRLLAKINQAEGNTYYLPHKSVFWLYKILFSYRKMGALTLSFVLFFFALSIPYTEAETRNEIIVNTGIVYTKSLGGTWNLLEGKREIRIGDQIKTSNNSSAEIYFANNSVVRISENTRLNISHLDRTSSTNLKEKIETVLQLQEGRLWTNVLPKNAQQNFSIETKNSRVSTSYGVFDIEEHANTTIRTLQHEVNVESRTSTQALVLSAGYETKLSNVSQGIYPLSSQNDSWNIENQKKDVIFATIALDKAKENIKKVAGVLPTNPLYDVKQVVDSFHQTAFTTTIKTFASSKALMNLGNTDLALKQFTRASHQLSQLWTDINSREQITRFIQKEKTFFVQVLPEDTLWSIKPYFEDLFIAYANNPELEEKNQLSNTLLSVQNISIKKDSSSKILIASLDDFRMKNSNIIEKSFDQKSKKELESLLSLENKNLQALQNIETFIDNEELKEKTLQIKQDLVHTIQKIVKTMAPEQKTIRLVNRNQAEWFAEQVKIMVDKVEIYNNITSRKNTIFWILNNIQDNKENLTLLYALKEAMPQDVHLPISQKILKIRQGK